MTRRACNLPAQHYYRVGRVERGARYEWHDAYTVVTEHGVLYGWLTEAEARKQAKSEGFRAVFHKETCSPEDAREAERVRHD